MTPKYCFPAKRVGWGWGMPVTWQGWLVLLLFFALLIAGGLLLLPARGELVFLGYTALLVALLACVCWLKGEPPRWRWRWSRDQ